MELKYSITGVPYINFDNENKLIFSKSTKGPLGYKYLVFSGKTTTTVELSGGRGVKGKKKVSVDQNTNFNTDMLLSKIPTSCKGNKHLSKINMGILRSMIGKYLINDMYFPENCFPLLEKDLIKCDIDETDMLNDDPSGYVEDEEEDLEMEIA
jgi:hypothetical protein